MVDVRIEEAKAYHCGALLRRLRREHAQSLALIGFDAHRNLRQTFDNSPFFRRSAFFDDRLAMMWGVTGSVLAPWGFVWCVVSNEATRHPKEVVRICREALDEMTETRVALVTTVLGADATSLRFCAALGFHCAGEEGGRAHTMAGRRRLVRYAEGNPDLRVPAGNSFVITMGYQPEARP